MALAIIFDVDGVIRDVGSSYRRAIADTVEHFTRLYLDAPIRPTSDQIDQLKQEGIWNNDWQASQELIYRAAAQQGQPRSAIQCRYETLVSYFQTQYLGSGETPDTWTGYITSEPLLVDKSYFETLTQHRILWGFFSGAPRAEVNYCLLHRLDLHNPAIIAPAIIAMEDAPAKPDPTGLLTLVAQLDTHTDPIQHVLYCGDTNSDMKVMPAARNQDPQRQWVGIGILPPHLWNHPDKQMAYRESLQRSGATLVLQRLTDLSLSTIRTLVSA